MNEQEQQPTGVPENEPGHNPRVYVACLGDYNAGILHGTWLDADDTPEGLQEGIDHMLAESPAAKRWGELPEEWAIHDYEGFGDLRIDEYESIERLSKLGRGIAEHGPAFAAWVANQEIATGDLNKFSELFRGEWPSMEAYAEEVLDELGAYEAIANLGEWFAPYVRIDSEAFARDISMDMNVVETSDGRVFVFDPS